MSLVPPRRVLLTFTSGPDAPLLAGAPATPPNGYVAEDGTTFYVAEDGVTFYVQET